MVVRTKLGNCRKGDTCSVVLCPRMYKQREKRVGAPHVGGFDERAEKDYRHTAWARIEYHC